MSTSGTTETLLNLKIHKLPSQKAYADLTDPDPNTLYLAPEQYASTEVAGIVQLSSSIESADERVAATANAVKRVNDRINALDFSDPTASTTTATTFIDAISQADGKIHATKKTLPVATTAAQGIVKLSNEINSDAENVAATSKAVKSAVRSLQQDYNETIQQLDSSITDISTDLSGHISTTTQAIKEIDQAKLNKSAFKLDGTTLTITL